MGESKTPILGNLENNHIPLTGVKNNDYYNGHFIFQIGKLPRKIFDILKGRNQLFYCHDSGTKQVFYVNGENIEKGLTQVFYHYPMRESYNGQSNYSFSFTKRHGALIVNYDDGGQKIFYIGNYLDANFDRIHPIFFVQRNYDRISSSVSCHEQTGLKYKTEYPDYGMPYKIVSIPFRKAFKAAEENKPAEISFLGDGVFYVGQELTLKDIAEITDPDGYGYMCFSVSQGIVPKSLNGAYDVSLLSKKQLYSWSFEGKKIDKRQIEVGHKVHENKNNHEVAQWIVKNPKGLKVTFNKIGKTVLTVGCRDSAGEWSYNTRIIDIKQKTLSNKKVKVN